MRVAVYTDQAYWRHGDSIYAARAFVVFLGQLARSLDRLVVLGRLSPEPQRSHYRLADEIDFVPLPYHADASNPLQAAGTFAGSLRAFWRTLRDVDAVWLLGPYPLSLAYVLLALLSRKRVVLGVRQDMPQYIRNRRPGKRWIHLAGDLLEHAYRLLARRLPDRGRGTSARAQLCGRSAAARDLGLAGARSRHRGPGAARAFI